MKAVTTHLGPIRLATNYVLADFKRRPRNYYIGIFAVFIVASFASLLASISQITSLFLVNIAENSVGDYDFIMYPSYESLNPGHQSIFLNYTEIKAKLSSINSIRGVTPRLYAPVTIMNADDRSLQASGLAIIEDSKIENDIGLGRRQDFEILGKNEALVTQSLIDTLKPKDGKIIIKLNMFQSLVDILAKVFPERQAWSLRSMLDPEYIAFSIIKPLEGFVSKAFPNARMIKIGDIRTKVNEALTITSVGALFGGNVASFASYLGFDLTNFIQNYNPSNSFIAPFFEKVLPNLLETLTIKDINDVLTAVRKGLDSYEDSEILDLYIFCYDALVSLLSANEIEIEAQVKQTIVTPKGKWPSVNGHAVAIDYQHLPYYFIQHLKNNLEKPLRRPPLKTPPQNKKSSSNETEASTLPLLDALLSSGKISELLENQLKTVNHYDYALLLTVILRDKLDTYNSYQTMFQKLSLITDKIYRAIGLEFPVTIVTNLFDSILEIKDIPMFTDMIFLAINFLLNLLCAVLIYSLLNSDIQEKSFEFGTLRGMGLDRNGLLSLMIVRSTLILVPGLILGNTMSYVIYTMVCYVVFNSLHLSSSFYPPLSIFLITSFWGIFLVLLASAYPIMRVLSRSLAQSINVMQRSINEIVVVIKRLEDVGMSSSQIIGSLLLSVFGFSMYYLAPSAYLTKNFSYFLNTMASLLLLTIFAMIMMLGFLQAQMQSVLLAVLKFFWKELRFISQVIRKNFISHRAQNFRTANMIGIAFGFMIFGIASFGNLGNIFTAFLRAYNTGSDLSVISSPADPFELPEKAVREFFANYTQEYPDHIANYTMSSNALDRLGMFFGQSNIVPLNGLSEVKFVGWAVEPNFLASTFSDFYKPGEMDPSVNYSLISKDLPLPNPMDSLYSNEGLDAHQGWDAENITSGVLAEKYKDQLEEDTPVKNRFIKLMISPDLIKKAGLHLGSIGRLSVGGLNRWWFKVRAIPEGLPWYRFTANRVQPGDNPVALLSMEDFGLIQREFMETKLRKQTNQTKELENWSYGVHKKYLFVKFAKDLNDTEVQSLRNRLLEIIKSDSMKLMVTKDFVKASENALFFFTIFTVVVGLLGLFLAFFVSWNSAWTNIRSNEIDIGILRAVGVTQHQLIVIFIVENMCVALIGSFNGTLIGILASTAFTVEASIFTYTPLTLTFPVYVVGLMILVTLGLTLFASKLAIEDILIKQISQSFKKDVVEISSPISPITLGAPEAYGLLNSDDK